MLAPTKIERLGSLRRRGKQGQRLPGKIL